MCAVYYCFGKFSDDDVNKGKFCIFLHIAQALIRARDRIGVVEFSLLLTYNRGSILAPHETTPNVARVWLCSFSDLRIFPYKANSCGRENL